MTPTDILYKSQQSTSQFGNAKKLQELKRPVADNFFKQKAQELYEQAKAEHMMQQFSDEMLRSPPSRNEDLFSAAADDVDEEVI